MLKRIGIIVTFILLALLGVVSIASAQQGPNLDINQLLKYLGPNASSAVPAYLSFILYAIFVLSFITMFVVPDKQSNLGYLMIGVMLAALLVKVQFFYICGLITLILNITMMVVPFLVGAMSRGEPGKPPNSLYLGIITGLLGGAYFFLFWSQVQSSRCPPTGVGIDQLFGPFMG
jgi:hypothetical protein